MLLVVAAVWVACILVLGWVGLATTLAAVAVPVAAAFAHSPSLLAFGLAAAALVTFAHRGNLARIRAGTEPRAQKLGLFRPRGPRR